MALLFALKLLLISTGVLFTALGVHVSVPLITDFVVTHVSLTWDLIHSCHLNPPYLFLLLNAIIISIAASTMFHNSLPPPPLSHSPSPPPPLYVAEEEEEEFPSPAPVNVKTMVVNGVADSAWSPSGSARTPPASSSCTSPDPPLALVDVKTVVVNGVATDTEEEDGLTESAWTPPDSAWTHPAASSASPDSAEVTPPAMDDVWKAITEGRKMMKRSETFDERKRERLVRKEPLLSRDELNRRVEEFIRKNGRSMRR